MSNLFNRVRAEMQHALDATIKYKPIVERLHNTMAAACGLSNNCDSKTIIAEAKSIIGMEYHWIKPIYDEYIFILNNTLDKYEFDIISNLLKELERLEKNAWLGRFDNAFNNPQPFQISPINNPDVLNQVFENTDVEHVIPELDEQLEQNFTNPTIFNKPKPEPIFTNNVSVETIEEEPKEETKEEPKPTKRHNWEDIVERDYFGKEYIWITWENDIPKNKYRIYRNGVIENGFTDKPISINSKTDMITLTSTTCTCADRTSAINKVKAKSYWQFIREIESMYPDFLDSELIKKAKNKKASSNKNNGTRNEDKIELTSLFSKTIHPIPEGGHYRQLDGRKFGLTGCYAINKYGHVVNRESKVVTNAIERNGIKYITIETKEFEFQKLMLGAVRIDDPRVKDIEQEFLMRDLMIPVTWIEDIPAGKYIYIKGKGVYNTVSKVFLKRTKINRALCFKLTSTMNEQHVMKGTKKGTKKNESIKKKAVKCDEFIQQAEKHMTERDNIN